jgi:hypothetical protein
MKEYLDGLKRGLHKYFPELNDSFEWIRSPFLISVQTLPNDLSASEEKQLLELASDGFLKTTFQQKTLTSFWLSVCSEYPTLSNKAAKYLLLFPTSYTCELGFLVLVGIKTKSYQCGTTSPS